MPTPPRVTALANALQTLPSDVVCLTGYPWDSDKDALFNAAASRFPYAYYAHTDLDSAPNDPAEQDGTIPPTQSDAPCADDKDASLLATGFDCVQDHCSTIAGSGEGSISGSSCVQANCTSELLGLLTSADPYKRCYVCAVQTGFQHSIDYTRQACTTDARATVGFDGKSPVMLLSRYPLSAQATYVLPSTWLTQVAIKAQVRLPNDAAVDVYCSAFGPVRDGLTYPYTGYYGEGALDKVGWSNEQQWQAQKLVSFVEKTSTSRPAVILGNFAATRAEGSLMEFGAPETIEYLESKWKPATAPDYTPACTVCADNPSATADSSYQQVRGFVKGIEPSAIESTARTFMDSVDYGDAPGSPSPGPISSEYGLRSVISIDAP
ncbi:MAG TPA: hypothetical protein VHZ95_15635 [Polyangiales bacterium]|nr:hypothetical protein [Polyangiales bacterium]